MLIKKKNNRKNQKPIGKSNLNTNDFVFIFFLRLNFCVFRHRAICCFLKVCFSVEVFPVFVSSVLHITWMCFLSIKDKMSCHDQ